jgi:translocation and assembly module TamB
MRRVIKVLLILVAVIVLVPVAAVLAVNTPPGARLVERLTASLTGGTVLLRGLHGRFPDAPVITQVTVADGSGVWLTIDDLALDWSPSRLLLRDAFIEKLSATRIAVARLPISQPSAAPSQGGSFSLPVRVDAARIDVGRIEVGAPVAGVAAVLALDGQVHLTTLTEGSTNLHLRRLDGGGIYDLTGQVDAMRLAARLAVSEPAQGLLASLAGLPDLGALSGQLDADGPWSATTATLSVAAGKLRAAAHGQVNFSAQKFDLDLSATAPAMSPAQDVAWQSVALDAHAHGAFLTPDATGQLDIRALAAGGARVQHIAATLSGNAGHVGLQARLEGVAIPGPKPDLLAGSPVVVQADAQLDAPARSVTFSVQHRLVQLAGQARTVAPISGQARLILPDLAPLAQVGGVALLGHAALDVKAALAGDSTTVDVDGGVSVSGGMAPIPGLLGDSTVGVTATLRGQDILLSRLRLDGATAQLSASGGLTGGVIKLDWQLALSKLAVLAPNLAGTLQAHGDIAGPEQDFAARADLAGSIVLPGFPAGSITASIAARGLPNAPTGTLAAQGGVAGAPLSLALGVQRGADGAIRLAIDRADWKSAHAEGSLQLAQGAVVPTGHVSLRMANLADLRPMIGQDVSGQVRADADLSDPALGKFSLQADALAVPGARIGRATLAGTVRDPATHPVVDAKLAVADVQAGGVGGQAQVQVRGPQDALMLDLNAGLTNLAGADATMRAAATLNATARSVLLASMQAVWRDQTLRLLAPAKVSFADGVAVDRLQLGLGQAAFSMAGRVSPSLDVTASLSHVTPDLARLFDPSLDADGVLQAQARLTGTPAQPAGTISVSVTGLRLRSGPGRALPAAAITATATLAGRSAQIDAHVTAGSNRLTLSGQAPLDPSGPLDLRAVGGVDLALLDPILSANGQRVRGQLSLDTRVNGTASSPALAGTIRLTGGDVQDFAQGAHLSNIQATLLAAGRSITIETFTAAAGSGTLAVGGHVGVLEAGIPLDLKITARNARPLSSDLLTATLDADLTLRGQAEVALAAAGNIRISSANIQIPDQLPTSVAVLNVRVLGQKPPPPPAPPPNVALDLTVLAPQGIFVRGHGLNAEMSGDLHVGGTAANPVLSRGFTLIRGTFSLAGVTLNFSTGEVTFNGAGQLDPAINFVANSANSSVTATLTISGYADKPKITLSSTPDLPQDEILSRLLFNQSVASLSPFQLAEIAAALAQISGALPGTGDPLGRVRSGLGLDQLNVGSNSTGAPTLNAGRYVAPGIYVGAIQGLSGSAGSQATVQIDITKGLKLQTDVGSGTGANSVGLTYQFNY